MCPLSPDTRLLLPGKCGTRWLFCRSRVADEVNSRDSCILTAEPTESKYSLWGQVAGSLGTDCGVPGPPGTVVQPGSACAHETPQKLACVTREPLSRSVLGFSLHRCSEKTFRKKNLEKGLFSGRNARYGQFS